VHLGTKVTTIDRDGVTFDGGERIAASVVVWGAGVRATPLLKTLGVKLDRVGRVEVENDCSVPGHPDAFVIGDAMVMKDKDGNTVPGQCPAAIQQGRFVAKIIARESRGKKEERPRFVYLDRGQMATIGRSRAITQIGKMHLRGFLAWLAWLFVHLIMLIGFRNRAVVLFTWFWSYVTYRRGARLITSRH
jgi:NADH dehydrogenase